MTQKDFSPFLCCKICKNQLNDPVLLSCNHSFCLSCIKEYLSHSRFNCPFCETKLLKFTTAENLQKDAVAQKMIYAQLIKKQVESSRIHCSECIEEREAVSYCRSCGNYLCDFHQKNHQITKQFKSHQLTSLLDSINNVNFASLKCCSHDRMYDGFCKSCFELICYSCSLSTHKAPQHTTCPFNEMKEEEEKQALNYMIQEGLKSVGQIKNSLQEIDQMLHKTQERSASLIKASDKFFFDLFQRILPEIQAEVKVKLQTNEKVLQDQKSRSEIHLCLLENELRNAKLAIDSNNIQGMVLSKVELCHLFSLISSSFFIPQCTDNINLSCFDYDFNSPNEEFTLADQQLIISSIVNIFSQMFGINLTIPTLVQIESSLKNKTEIEKQQKQRKYQEEQRKRYKLQEEHELKEKLIQDRNKRKLDMNDIFWHLGIAYPQSLTWQQVQIENWIGIKNWQLLYKATRDGFKASDFHSKCDNQGSTVTIITSKEGYIFGGYTPLPWKSPQRPTFLHDISNQTFIFTLINPYNIPPTKYFLHEPENAIECHTEYGPRFGRGSDISIYNQSNDNVYSYTVFPTSYLDTTGKGKATFTGFTKFGAKEIEVFHISD